MEFSLTTSPSKRERTSIATTKDREKWDIPAASPATFKISHQATVGSHREPRGCDTFSHPPNKGCWSPKTLKTVDDEIPIDRIIGFHNVYFDGTRGLPSPL
jgi:hypothetical protein